MIDRSTAPKIQALENFQLQTPRKETLQNGIPVFFIDNEHLDLIHILIRLKTGILHEDTKHIATFTYGLLKESAPKHNANEMADLFDFYGTHYTCSVSLDNTTLTISVPRSNISKILPEIYEFLATPCFREENLSIYKNLKVKDLEYNAQKTDVQSTRLMLHAMFGDAHTAGQFSTRDNIQAVSIAQMLDFHRKTFCAENIRIFVTGNVDDQVHQSICDTFGQVPHGVAAADLHDLRLPADPSPIIAQEMPNSVQSSITICQPLMGYTHEDRCDFSILSTITGGYFGSRLMQNLREKNGYTYGISCGSSYFGNQSLFLISSDVNIQHTQAAIDACFEELHRLQTEPIPEEELSTAKNYILGDQIRDLDNSVSYLKRYVFWDKFNTDENEFYRIIDRVKNIDAERIQNLAKKYFAYNKFTQIIVGRKL